MNFKRLIPLVLLVVALIVVPMGAMAETYEGDLPTYDESLYTWKINATLGGATNLPAVNLAATGKYSNVTNVNDELMAALTTTTFVDANNMIFIISDGFGNNDITVSEKYGDELILNNLPNVGQHTTLSYAKPGEGDGWVTTDSAAAGTALSSGFKTRYSYEGLDKDGNDIPQITEILREKFGKIIGVVSTGWAYDATPADYAGAHAVRGNSSEIARDIIRGFVPDLFIGQGVNDYNSTFNSYVVEMLCKGVEQIHTDWNTAIASGHESLWISIEDDDTSENGDVRYTDGWSTSRPTISQMMAFSLKFLQQKSDNRNNVGFFLMFENGMTDDAGHNNNMDQKIGEVHATDEAVAIALKFACENPDTIVIVTTDHDTGGLTLNDGWDTDITKAKWTTTGHSQQTVTVSAIGKNTEVFNGQEIYNVQVGKIAAYLMGITEEEFGDQSKEYSITDIVKGIKVNVGNQTTVENALVDDVLHIRADKDMTSMQVVLSGIGAKVHDMITIAVKVPAGATSIKITGANEILIDQELDKALNYVADYDFYFLTFKPTADTDTLTIEFAGDIKAKDEVWVDSLTVASNTTNFTGYDVSKVTASEGVTVKVAGQTALPEDATDEIKPGNNNTGLWIGISAAAVVAIVVVVVLVSKKKK